MKFHRKNQIFAAVFIFLIAVVIFTFSGVFSFDVDFIVGIPVPVLWAAGLCFAFLVLALLGYIFLFKKWAQDIDS
jgi:hypothetical protein